MEHDNDFGVEPESLCSRHGLPLDECKKCDAAARARGYRKIKKAEKEADRSQTVEQFWKAQRSLIPPATLAAMLERQERVKDQVHWMTAQMNGSYDADPNDASVYVGLEEGVADLLADVREHGLTQTLIYQWKNYWQIPEHFEMLTSPKASAADDAFARYGVVIGVPERLFSAFQEFLSQEKSK